MMARSSGMAFELRSIVGGNMAVDWVADRQ